MGKKTASDLSGSRRSKPKHKAMFTQLATLQQEIIQEQPAKSNARPRRSMIEESDESVELEVLQHQNKNLDSICDAVHRLLSKNKVSAKNAFTVPLIDLEELPDFADSVENEFAWKRLSSTLENDYKIYGYRVDAIHSITYSMLNTMSRRQQDIDNMQKQASAPQDQGNELPILKINEETSEALYLQKKRENLNLTELELVMKMDPILERTKRQFDTQGPNSLMLDSLPIDDVLCLQLVRKNEGLPIYPPWGDYSDTWNVEDPLMALVELSNFRSVIRDQMEGPMRDESQENRMIDEEMAYMLLDEKQNYFNGNSSAHDYRFPKRSITEEISLRHLTFKNEHDIAQDAERWMGEIDRKFLGVKDKKNTIKQETSHLKIQNSQDPAQMVDFGLSPSQQVTRNNVFKPESDKLEHHEEIEDRFLLTINMNNTFDLVQYPLFLKESFELPDQQDLMPAMEAQIDVRRQQVSILQAKKRIKEQMHTRSTFRNIYSSYCEHQDISPALCFLTILHLANENDLTLKQIDQTNFHIQ